MGKKEIIEEIEKMSVLELAELVKELSEKFGVSAMPTVSTAAVSGGAAAPAEGAAAAEEKTEFSVILKSVGDKKIQVIKVIRELTNLGLKEAKDIADTPPKAVKDGLSKDQAQEFKKKLEESGAEVEIK